MSLFYKLYFAYYRIRYALISHYLGSIRVIEVCFGVRDKNIMSEIKFLRVGPDIELLRFLLIYLCRVHRFIPKDESMLIPAIDAICLDHAKKTIQGDAFSSRHGLAFSNCKIGRAKPVWKVSLYAKGQRRVVDVIFPDISSEMIEASAFFFLKKVWERLRQDAHNADLMYHCLKNLTDAYYSQEYDFDDLQTVAVLPQRIYMESLLTFEY